MKALGLGALLAGALLCASPAAADVRLTIANGQVSLAASNATVRQILTEWARVGQTRIVNIERAGGAPTTIEITGMPEVDVLEILLRSVGGYILAPRHVDVPNASQFDRILILPASSSPSLSVGRPAGVAGTAPTQPQPQFMPPRRLDEDSNDGLERPAEPGNAQPTRPPGFNAFPQPARSSAPQPAAPQPSVPQESAPMPTSVLSAPAGVPVPGMVASPPPSADRNSPQR